MHMSSISNVIWRFVFLKHETFYLREISLTPKSARKDTNYEKWWIDKLAGILTFLWISVSAKKKKSALKNCSKSIKKKAWIKMFVELSVLDKLLADLFFPFYISKMSFYFCQKCNRLNEDTRLVSTGKPIDVKTSIFTWKIKSVKSL